MAIEVFIVCVSVLQPIRYSNSGAVCGTGIPACPLCESAPPFYRTDGNVRLLEIRFAGCSRYDSMPKLVLHSSHPKSIHLVREDCPNMAHKPRLQGLGILILCV